jgi:AcrR family transcriptional regulator
MSALMRKDALRSRRAILDAARELYRDDIEASFAEIAHRAGVGQATVYRHFADRRALVLRLLEEDMEALEERFESEPISAGSFEHIVSEVISLQLDTQGALGAIRLGEVEQSEVAGLAERFGRLLAPRIEAATAAGAMRADLGPDDMPLLFSMIDGALSHAGIADAREEAGRRAFEIVMDGLRSRA